MAEAGIDGQKQAIVAFDKKASEGVGSLLTALMGVTSLFPIVDLSHGGLCGGQEKGTVARIRCSIVSVRITVSFGANRRSQKSEPLAVE
ncbi:hypothetical protein [Paraburkholderia sp. RL17-373-BIF-A]|uniref:hypothetical protein n=1 Tax=Paraburkholderia sp. RL17-373-BIF-A TaxID=3031629 RepID=UPI0038BB4926